VLLKEVFAPGAFPPSRDSNPGTRELAKESFKLPQPSCRPFPVVIDLKTSMDHEFDHPDAAVDHVSRRV
jgi:hypothetical protein